MSEKNKNIPKLCSCINSNDSYLDIDIYYNIEEDKVIKFYFVYSTFKSAIENICDFPCMIVDTCKQQCKILDGCFNKIKKCDYSSALFKKQYHMKEGVEEGDKIKNVKEEMAKIKEAIDCIDCNKLKKANILDEKIEDILKIINDNKEQLNKEIQENIDNIFKKYYLFGLTCLGDISKEDKQNSCCGCFYF